MQAKTKQIIAIIVWILIALFVGFIFGRYVESRVRSNNRLIDVQEGYVIEWNDENPPTQGIVLNSKDGRLLRF